MIPLFLLTRKAKLIGVGILILVLGYAYRRQIVKAEERGASRKEVIMLVEEGKRIDSIVASRLALYASQRASLDGQLKALTGELNAIVSQRDAINSALRAQIAANAAKESEIETEIRNVPASALDGRIRSALDRARAADAELARIRASN